MNKMFPNLKLCHIVLLILILLVAHGQSLGILYM